MLMIIDNFEHVLDAAPLLASLLEDAPQVTLLCTSRARLKLSFECVYPVAPCAVATAPAAKGSDELGRSDAVRLFALRASSARSDFVIDCANIEAVADICRRLDGLPLAIELAAARSNTLPPAALRDRLQHPESVLQDVASDRPDRQKTMRDTVAWSYLLLSPNEQQFFRTMTVFSRGFSLVAAAAVWESAEAKDCQRGPVPERMVINAADVVNKVETLEIVDGVMQAPTGPNVVSWYKETARLGESNNMVMAAHVNWWNVPEGVFFHLQNLEEGERVEITGQDGKTYVYEVEWVRQESNLAAPDPHVVGPTDVPSLTMITCGGEWDPTISEYNERTVARAVQVEVIDADRDMPDIGESRTSMMLAA
jgi:sortase (surface protein transpeptidase)